jgi:hypothetical protein
MEQRLPGLLSLRHAHADRSLPIRDEHQSQGQNHAATQLKGPRKKLHAPIVRLRLDNYHASGVWRTFDRPTVS